MAEPRTCVDFHAAGARFPRDASANLTADLAACDQATRDAFLAQLARRVAAIGEIVRRDGVEPHRARLFVPDPCPNPHRPHDRCSRRGCCEICGDVTHPSRGGTCPLCVGAIKRVRALARDNTNL